MNPIEKYIQISNELGLSQSKFAKKFDVKVHQIIERFPDDFMFQLSDQEWDNLRSQFATSKESKGGRGIITLMFLQSKA